MSKILDYNETLEMVENFMIKTGIRDYCTNVCKGTCCGSCSTKNVDTCSLNEGRRLVCSTFFCWSLPDRYLSMLLYKSHLHVSNFVSRISHSSSNIFFSKPPEILFTDFKIDSELISSCYIEPIDRAKEMINKVLECRNRLQRLGQDKLSHFICVECVENDKIIHYTEREICS